MTELENNHFLIVQVSALIGPDPMVPMECKEAYNCFAACKLSKDLILSYLLKLNFSRYIFSRCAM